MIAALKKSTQKRFGHWDIDTVIVNKVATNHVLLVLVERKTRYEVILKIKHKTTQAVTEALVSLCEHVVESLSQLFKSLTSIA